MWDYTLCQIFEGKEFESMKQQDLRGLSRGELLELLVQQGEEIERLKEQLMEREQQLQDKKLALNEAGSIAEAAMKINGVFEAAQTASAQYLENIQQLVDEQKSRVEDANMLRVKTEAECAAMRAETMLQCEKMLEKAKRESLSYWTKVSRKLGSVK